MQLLRRCYGKLRLVINEAKSTVTSVFGRKFLGYALWSVGLLADHREFLLVRLRI
tara:strand:+ start:369 stop:533 length:165 start_codon:yes stop_codon:yes gene_type:complete